LPDYGRPLDRSIPHLGRRGKNTALNAWLFCSVHLLKVTSAASETVVGHADERTIPIGTMKANDRAGTAR